MGERLGQHFLRGTWAAHTLAKEARVSAGDTVLEIGPGKGVLTRELLKTGAHVVAIEKDEALVVYLRDAFKKEIAEGALEVIQEDVRNITPLTIGLSHQEYVVAANIPYYITGEILRQFLTTEAQPRLMALLVQKEVAERIVARDKKESILSLSVKAFGTPHIAAKVSRGNFSPPPKVDSAILIISDISRAFFSDLDEKVFFSTVRKGFSSKRKQLVGNLVTKTRTRPIVLESFGSCGIADKVRAEDVPLAVWKCLSQELPKL